MPFSIVGLIINILGWIIAKRWNKRNVKIDITEQNYCDQETTTENLFENEALVIVEKFKSTDSIKKFFARLGVAFFVFIVYIDIISICKHIYDISADFLVWRVLEIVEGLVALFVFKLIGILINKIFNKVLINIELSVTDKRVFGCTAFGKRVDLPIDSISAVGTNKIFRSVVITTASGSISFSFLSRYESFHKEINNLLINRQSKIDSTQRVVQNNSNADEIKKYKDLLDSGVITQEEYEQKKKQLLGL